LALKGLIILTVNYDIYTLTKLINAELIIANLLQKCKNLFRKINSAKINFVSLVSFI